MTSIAPAVPHRSLIGRVLTALFVAIGVLACIAALLAALLNWTLTSGDAPANGARDAFVSYSNELDGVSTTTANIASSNMQQPFNVDATVTLAHGCSLDSLEKTVGTIQRHIAGIDQDVQVHPVLTCADMSLGVSPVREITDERMRMLRELLDLPAATGAAVTFPQPGFDRFVDDDNDGATLAVSVASRDAVVPMTRQLMAHPPGDISIPKIRVVAGPREFSYLLGADGINGFNGESQLTIAGSTATTNQLLDAITAISPHVLRSSALVTTPRTDLDVEVATAEQGRIVEGILADSGADLARVTVAVRLQE